MKLTIQPAGREAEQVELTEPGKYVIGRINQFGTIGLYHNINPPKIIAKNHNSISRREHLEIILEKESLTLNDMQSTNGSFLNEERFKSRTIDQTGTYQLKLGKAEFTLNYEK